MREVARASFLDTIWARLIAGLVALAASGLLAYLNLAALTGTVESGGDGPLTACLEKRLGYVEAMVADGVVKTGHAAELRIRARQQCGQTAQPD